MTVKDINEIIKIVCPNDEDYEKPCISPKYLRQELEQLALEQEHRHLEQEPTTKNDLGVDCISREKALGVIRNLYPSMPRIDFDGSLRKWVDKYKPYIECEDAIEQLSSVTPQPRKGHWEHGRELSRVFIGDTLRGINYEDWHCSNCHCVVEQSIKPEWSYCPNCGAKMAEQEGTCR